MWPSTRITSKLVPLTSAMNASSLARPAGITVVWSKPNSESASKLTRRRSGAITTGGGGGGGGVMTTTGGGGGGAITTGGGAT